MLFLSACTTTHSVDISKGRKGIGDFKSAKKGPTISIKKSKNGIYILKDESVTNSAGVVLNPHAQEQQIGPGEVKFDYENFKTRY